MGEKIVVSPDLTLDWLRKKKRIFGELEEQLIRGLETPGSGLTLEDLQVIVEHRTQGGLIPPPGARIRIFRVKYDANRPWAEVVEAAGPNTPNNYDVWKAGDLYPPTSGQGVKEAELVLVNYPEGNGDLDETADWAAKCGLKRTAPRAVFAFAEEHHDFHRELGQDHSYVVATEECTFEGYRQVCDVWRLGVERRAGLDRVASVGDSGDWFAFSRECL